MHNHVIRETNATVVLEALRANGHASRAELSKLTSLTPQALGPILRDLVAAERAVEQVRERRGPGRPPKEFAFNADGSHAALIAVKYTEVEILLTNAIGYVIGSCTFRHDGGDAAEPVVARCIAELRSLAEANQVAVDGLDQVVFAIEGRVDDERLVVHETSAWQERKVDLRQLVASQLAPGTELKATSAERALAASVVTMSDADPADLVAVVHMSYDIWLFLAQGRRLITSSTGNTGLLSHMPIAGNDLECACGRVGCFATVIGQKALAARYERYSGRPIIDGVRVLEAITEGDPHAVRASEVVAKWLVRGLEPWLRMVDPDRVVLTGPFGDAEGTVATRLVEILRTELDGALGSVPLRVVQPNLAGLLIG